MDSLKDYIINNNENIIPLEFFRKYSQLGNDNIVLSLEDFPKGDYNLISFRHGFISITQDEPLKIKNEKRRLDWLKRTLQLVQLNPNYLTSTPSITGNTNYAQIPKEGLLHLITTPFSDRLDDVLKNNSLIPVGLIYCSRFFSDTQRLYMINTEK